MKIQERGILLDNLLEGVISETDFLRIAEEMENNPETRQAYYDRLKLHTALLIDAESSLEYTGISQFPKRRVRTTWLAGAVAAALMVSAGIVGWQMGRVGERVSIVKSEPAAKGFAVVADQSDAVWNHPGSLGSGDLLPHGPVELNSGIVQLELFSGVTVLIEGAAEFEIISPMEMSISRGKVRAFVPEPARGFRMHSASGDVVDLGTEFALNVTPEKSDLLVLKGEVEWHPLSKPMQRLKNGESLRWTSDGIATLGALDPADFPQTKSLQEHLDARREERRRAWVEFSNKLRHDPRLLAYFPMNQPGDWNRQLSDESGAKRNGTIVRAQRTADRWGSPAEGLDFSPTGSRVRLTIPGEHRSLTFFCWAKIDSLDRWYNSLFLTDGHELHEPHWQIMDDGRLFFSVKANNAKKAGKDKYISYSPPIWSPALSGKWQQIATVYNVDEATTTHYLNGRVVSVDHIPDKFLVDKVRIGAASIGNWSEPKRADPHFAVRNLNGAIDEFAIFSAALSTEEIQKLYEIGRP